MTLAKLFQEVEQEVFPVLFRREGCSGISLYETEESFIVEAAVPGVKAEEIKLILDRGGLSIEAQAVEEKKGVKVHCQAARKYSYLIPLPEGRVDEGVAPEAVVKEGILTVTFAKSKAAKPLKISVKS